MKRRLLPLLVVALSCADEAGPLATHAPAVSAPPPDAPPPIPARITLTSDRASVTIATRPFGMRVLSDKGTVVLDTLDGPVAGDEAGAYGPLGVTHRVTEIRPPLVIEGWDHQKSSDDPWTHPRVVVSARADEAHAWLELAREPGAPPLLRLVVTLVGAEVDVLAVPLGAGPALADGDDAEPGWNELGQAFHLAPDEHFLGLGERYVTVDHRGTHYECWTEEGGIGGGEKKAPAPNNPSPNGPSMTHLPVPFLLSSKGWGLWVETTYRTGFSLGADSPDAWRFYAVAPELRYRIFVHDDPKATLQDFTAATGRAPLPAPWVFGPRRRVDHGTLVNGVPEELALRKRGVPTTMVDDTNHFLPIASEKGSEPFLGEWTKQMHALGYKAIGYYNAYVSVDDPRAADLIAHGRERDLFVKLDSGAEFDTFMISAGGQFVATIDMSKPEAVEWYGTILQRALDLGYDGWMLDFGEYIPPRARLFDGKSGWEAHNAYPVLYQKATFDYLRKVRGDDFMFYARAGYTGTQAHVPVIWSGDPSASFDDTRGLPANVRAGVSAGVSGIPFWGSDISGYTCLNDPVPDKELYLRWAEFGALSSDMHDENACSQAPKGAPAKWNLWTDEETVVVYGSYARLHTRLNPYLHAAAKEAAENGMPIMRHPALMHPGERAAWSVDLEYYFGPSLYVAPVVRRGQTARDLWLPPGKWVDWWTLAAVKGGAIVTRDAPLQTMPIYLRVGGLVAMLDVEVETLAPDQDASVTSAAERDGFRDVRGAIDRATGTATAALTDGTTLTVTLGEEKVSLPPGTQAASNEAALQSCDGCGRLDAVAGAQRVRFTTSTELEGTATLGGLTLTHGPTTTKTPRKIRWEIVVVP